MVEWHRQSVDTCLSELQKIMKDREAWRAVFKAHGAEKSQI